MKHMKCARRILSILMALTLVLGMGVTVFAAPGDDTIPAGTQGFAITLTGVKTEGHQYTAYQVFSGDLLEKDGTKTLSNIEWGSGVPEDKQAALVAAIQAINLGTDDEPNRPFEKAESAREIAEVLNREGNAKDGELALAFADVVGSYTDTALNFLAGGTLSDAGVKQGESYTYTIGGLAVGYYLVLDTSGGIVDGDARTRNILEVVGNVSAEIKAETPSIEKKIVDGVAYDSVTYPDGSTEDFPRPAAKVDANTAGVGQKVTYEITGKVPDYTGYDEYFYVMNDTLSAGLTFDGNVEVWLRKGDHVTPLTVVTDPADPAPTADVYVYTTDIGSYSFRLAFRDIMSYDIGTDIIVRYSATVNENAIIGVVGNPNTVTLTYSNDPNHSDGGSSDRPGIPAETTNPPYGVTPEDITITYLTEIDITKYDGNPEDKKFLEGAEFTLTGTSVQYVLKDVQHYVVDNTNGTYYLLNDGTYTTEAPQTEPTLEETSEEAGYVELTEEELNAEGAPDNIPGVVRVGEKYYRPYKAGDAGTRYILVRPNNDYYAGGAVKYRLETTTELEKIETQVIMTATSGPDGKLSFEGLGAGTYVIEETGVPDGYNKAENLTVVVECEVPPTVTGKDNPATWSVGAGTIGSIEMGAKDDDSSIPVYKASVANFKGSLLPSTGGIGTTIFYVAGGFLVLAAVVLLVAKKRMSGAES